MENYMEFSSDDINIFLILLDSSGSMDENTGNVKKGLKLFQKSFNGFPEVNSIAVSVSNFDDDFYRRAFTSIREMEIDYYASGATALYYSIVKALNYLEDYVSAVTQYKGCIPKASFILLSDGEPCRDRMSRTDAEEEIHKANLAGINTVFVAFGSAISSEFGKKLGFMATTDEDNLVQFLGVELSKSVKTQSRSKKPLGANFFSHATSGNSEAYSNTTAQALEDDSWINDI